MYKRDLTAGKVQIDRDASRGRIITISNRYYALFHIDKKVDKNDGVKKFLKKILEDDELEE